MEGDAILVRRALATDGPDLARVVQAARRDALPYLPVLHSDEEDRRHFGRLAETATAWIAEADGRIVAMLVLSERYVDHLYVEPSHQGRGIGGRLLALAKSSRPEGLRLYTFQRNERARAFYERHGFLAVKFGDGSANEEGEPDVLYEWRDKTQPAA